MRKVRSSFFEFNVAVQGLYSARMGLNVVNHNITNASTPGFSRQAIEQRATRPMALNNGTGMLGTGSEVVSVQRIRSHYLDQKFWSENIKFGEYEVKANELAGIEALFNEPSNTGFSKIMNEFYSALSEMEKNPGDLSYRQGVKQMGIQLTTYFNNTAQSLQRIQRELNDAVQNKVDQINSYASQIATLNKQIYNLELDGNRANDLRDQRDLIVDKLSKIVDVQVSEITVSETADSGDVYQNDRGRKNQHFIVTIGNGQTLVNHFHKRELKTVQRDSVDPTTQVAYLKDVVWKDNEGVKLAVSGGELKGYLDMRDGDDGKSGANYRGIPYYMERLNRFVQNFAMSFNEGKVMDLNGIEKNLLADGGHAQGKTLNGDTGIRFFSFDGVDYKNITALNFSLSQDVLSDVRNIAAGDPSGIGATNDAKMLRALMGLRHNNGMFTEGEPEDFMRSIISVIAVDNNQAKRFSENQGNLLKTVDTQRESIKGVSLDEEMANMIKFQQAYNAAARIITTIDGIYDTTINRLGLVGR